MHARKKSSQKIKCTTVLLGVWTLLSSAHAIDFSQIKVAPTVARADEAGQNTQDPPTYVRGLKVFQDDVYDDDEKPMTLTAQQKHQAKVWGLRVAEEKRYLQLMRNRSGVYWRDSGLSPLEILGLNARTPSERAHFARLYAAALQARLAKELAWQVRVNQAKAKMNRDLPLVRHFNVRPFSPYHYQALPLKAGDQLFLLTRLHLNVRHIISTLLTEMKSQKAVSLHIYFAGHVRAQGVERWAARENIPVKAVSTGKITLNTQAGPLGAVKDFSKLPLLILVRDGKAHITDVSRF